MKAFVVACVLCALGCSSVPPSEIRSDYDTAEVENMRFYTRYDWLPEPDDSVAANRHQMSELDLQRFRNAIEAELEKRGFVHSAGSPDFLVGYDASLKRKMTASGGDTRYGVGFGTGGAGVGVSFGGGGSGNTYDEGTLSIGFVDARSNKLVWGGRRPGGDTAVVNTRGSRETIEGRCPRNPQAVSPQVQIGLPSSSAVP